MSELQLKQWFVGGRIGYDDDENQDDEYYLPVHDGLDGFEIDRPFAIVYGPAMVWYSDSSGYFGDRNIYNVPKHTFEIYRQGENDKKTKIAYLNNDIKLRFEELSFENQPMYWDSHFLKQLERGILNDDTEHTDFKITMNRFGHESGDAKKRKVPKVKPPVRVQPRMPLRQAKHEWLWEVYTGNIEFIHGGKHYEHRILFQKTLNGGTTRIKSFNAPKGKYSIIIKEQNLYDGNIVDFYVRTGLAKNDVKMRGKLDVGEYVIWNDPQVFHDFDNEMDAFLRRFEWIK